MYTCPYCNSHQITVRRWAIIVERWNGDDFESDYDDMAERTPDNATAVCDECGEETEDAEEWWTPF